MRITKRALAFFLTFVLVISALPMSAFADTAPDPLKDAVESIDAIEQGVDKAEKETLEDRQEDIENNTVEVTSGSSEGFELENGKTYVFKKNVEFTNSTPSGSAITVPEGATATMIIEKGVTVKATGSDSLNIKGAGAGINVPKSSKLIIRGEGTLMATGGNAAAGENGANGDHARFDKDSRKGNGLIFAGNGGAGGPGGGGAGAGIGGNGGNGGEGGAGGIYRGWHNGDYSLLDNSDLSLTLLSEPEGVNENELTSNLIDANLDTKCCVKKSGTVSIMFKASKPEKVYSYGFVTGNDNSIYGRLPSGWVIYGSDDKVNWDTIATVDNPNMQKANRKAYKYSFNKGYKYTYYKFDFTVSDYLQFSELSLCRQNTWHPASPTEDPQADWNGDRGSKGMNGNNGDECGTVYILEKVNVIAKPGKKNKVNGEPGKIGRKANDKGSGYNYYYYGSGGGGGGGGAHGEAPEYGIGSGGAGGAGGGGGGAGSTRFSKKDYYKDSEYAKGGTGGNAYSNGKDGREFGSQQGGHGGKGGDRPQEQELSGIVCADYDATVDGRLDGDILKGVYSINDDGTIVDMSGKTVENMGDLKLENNNLYRFVKDLRYSASNGRNAVTIPEETKVIFEIPKGVNVTFIGGSASTTTGAGAGIYVPESSTLVIRGSGSLTVQGGDAAAGSDSYSGGGAAAAIGGKGGAGVKSITEKAKKGTNCGKIYILGTITLKATPGRAGSNNSKFTGGRAPDYAIGGGGAGGNATVLPRQLSGTNGDVYIDYASKNVTGREAYFHRADLSIDLIGNVIVNGYSDMILGNEFSENVTTEHLYKTLREAANHGVLKQNKGWTVVDPSLQNDKSIETKPTFNGAYRKGFEWNKDILDVSGGYIYLFATYFGRYIKMYYDSSKEDPNPAWIVRCTWSDIEDLAEENGYYISNDMRTLMDEVLYFVHYTEPFDGNREKGYTEGNPTNDKYSSKGDALQQIDYSYTSILDCTTARYATYAYDTERTPKSWTGKSKYYYRMKRYSFKCVDGYKGVTPKNWMKYIPEDASVAQLNMPGTHDSGTFNVGFNWEAVEVVLSNLDKLLPQVPPYVPAGVGLICALAPIIGYAAAPLLSMFAPLFAVVGAAALVYAAYLASNIMYIYDNFIKALSQCNNLTITQQLESGIRTFDVRMIIDDEKDLERLNYFRIDDKDRYDVATYLKICHGTLAKAGLGYLSKHDVSLTDGHNTDGTVLTLKNMIEDSLAFVKENPSESVFLTLKCEGDDINGEYSKALDKVFEAAEGDSKVVVLKKGQIMPTVGDAAGKVYLIKRSYAEFREDNYDVSASRKIELLKECFGESNKIRQRYSEETPIEETRMIYSSTYDYDINGDFFIDPKNEYLLAGSPEELATGLGSDSINTYLDTFGYQRGQYYGWIYMNFPTQMATMNLIFSNVFDLKKLITEHNEGSIFTDFNGVVFLVSLFAFVTPVVVIPIVKKKKSAKESGRKGEDVAGSE